MADIIPSSPQGQALQAAIQAQLVSLGWATDDDDAVMSEYILVMLGNRKTSEQIETELADLVTTDFDPSFVTWLFTQVEKHYPSPYAAADTSAAAPSAAPAANNRGAPANNRNNIFGAALSGVKRDSRDLGSETREPPLQRARYEGGLPRGGGFEGVPAGPRGMVNGGRGGRNAGPEGGNSLLGRVQPAPGGGRGGPAGGAGGNTMGMPRAAFEAISQTIAAVNNGAPPSSLAAIPYPALAAHPAAQFLPPGVLAQAQAHAMAQAQAFAAMQGVWGAPPGVGAAGFGGPPAPNPMAPAFNPAFGGPGAGGRGGKGGFGGAHQQHQQQRNGPPAPAPAPPAPKSVVLPTKPEQEQICKHATECTKPPCPFSHPSPVATKESGLVLSSEACEKQLDCEDPDCPKSHVSPAQKKAPTGSSTKHLSTGSTLYTAPPSSSARAAPVADPSVIPGAGEKPCKFAGSCTRKGCVFLHPWDVRGDAGAAGQGVPCRWGAACTRGDCHFSHPPNRPSPYSKTFNGGASASSFSKTFNKPSSSSSSTPAIGSWPKEEATHVSERLKRFSVKEGEGEKIIPGAEGAVAQKKEGEGEDEARVEIDVEDEEEKKVEA